MGTPRGEAPRAAATRAGEGRGQSRRVREGGSGAALWPDTAPLLGASSCSAAAAASSQAASAGRLLGLCQHFPRSSRTPLGQRGLAHSRTRPQPARSLRGFELGTQRAGGGASNSPTEAPRLGESPLHPRQRRQTPTEARGQLSLSAEPTVRAGRAAGPRADPAAWGGRRRRRRPLLTFRDCRPGEPRGPLLRERLKARTRAQGRSGGLRGGESRAEPRATHSHRETERCPATIPKNSPVSSRLRSGTSACV